VHGTPDAPFSTPGTGVTIEWSVTGTDGAALAVDDPTTYGAYGTSYPAEGRQELPFACTRHHHQPHVHGVARGRAGHVEDPDRVGALRRVASLRPPDRCW
jgi:hypothetical protein